MSPDSAKARNSRATFIDRVVLRNYKSIAACDVRLEPSTFLVGRNGSGKSNFVDALRFVTDSLTTSLDHAIRERGGINEVRRRSAGHPTHFGARFHVQLSSGISGTYAFEIAARERGGFQVQDEACFLRGPRQAHFRVEAGRVRAASMPTPPPATADRLYLVQAAAREEFRELYDSFSRAGFYNLIPREIRELQPPEEGALLRRDGSNLASVIGRLEQDLPETRELVEQYLEKIAPGVRGIGRKTLGPRETIEFRQDVGETQSPWRFFAANMSDGTLRALGILVALFQPNDPSQPSTSLVAIEEPENALHPAALSVLLDAIREATRGRQVVVTSHSPDLLDDASIQADEILVVEQVKGRTRIGALDETTRGLLRDHLRTAGELLRMDQLFPDPVQADLPDVKLFEEPTSVA
jgi:predicted ATPase